MSTTDGEENPFRGKIMGGSSATISSGIRPGPARYLFYDETLRFTLLFSLGVVLGMALLAWGGLALAWRGGWLFGLLGYATALVAALVGLLGLIFLVLVPVAFKKEADLIENGLLSAGMVLGRDPLSVLVLTSVGNGSGAEYYGVGRMDLKRLPYHDHEKGTRVPCVCGFHAGDEPDRWASFECKPMCFATGRAEDIDRCFQRLDDEPFLRLQSYMQRGKLPESENQIILLDGQMNYLETIDRKALKGSKSTEVAGEPPPDDRD